ncbi:MAG: hypothetical protein U0271_28095 [Polyangiaceae bacterium]
MASLIGLALLSGCSKKPTTCELSPALVADASGRPDGLYGVDGDRLGAQPLMRFDELALVEHGVDEASGKPWLHVHMKDPNSHALADFTQAPEGRSLAVVVGGQVASHHKLRTPTTGSDFQVSCCNPAACERWLTLLEP